MKLKWKGLKRGLAFLLAIALVIGSVEWGPLMVWAAGETIVWADGKGSKQYDGTNASATADDIVITDSDGGTNTVTGIEFPAECSNVGSYTVSVTYTVDADTDVAEEKTADLTYEITAKELAVAWDNTALTYNGEAQGPTLTVNGEAVTEDVSGLGENVFVTVNGMTETAVGDYTATVELPAAATNYTLTGETSMKYSIGKKELAVAWDNTALTYNGEAQGPTLTVNGRAITGNAAEINVSDIPNEEVYVTVSGMTATEAGEHTATVELPDTFTNYTLTGETSQSYSIGKKDLAASNVELGGITETLYFKGEDNTVEFSGLTVTVDETLWIAGEDYTVSYTKPKINADGIFAEILTITPTDKKPNYSDPYEKTIELAYLDTTEDLNKSRTQLDGASKGWYDGELSLSAPDGYTFEIKNSDGSWSPGTSDAYANEGEYNFIYRLTADSDDPQINGAKTAERTISFHIDTKDPVVNDIVVGDADGAVIEPTTWATEKYITFTVDEANVAEVSYTVNEIKTVLPTTDDNRYRIKVAENCFTNGTVYTLTVKDMAGRVNETEEATVTNVDTQAPVITVDGVTTSGDIIYVNKATDFTVKFTDQENLSGIDDRTKTVNDVVLNGNVISFIPAIDGEAEQITYTIKAKDNAGTPAEEFTFTVLYDNEQVSQIRSEITDGTDAYPEGWLNKETVEGKDVFWTIELQDIDGNSNNIVSGIDMASIVVNRTREGGSAEPVEATPVGDEDGIVTVTVQIPNNEDFNGIYTLSVSDKAGNAKNYTQQIQLDVTKPEIGALTLYGKYQEDKGDRWYNSSELFIKASIIEETSGLLKKCAKEGTTETEIEGSQVEGSEEYTFKISEENFDSKTFVVYAVDQAGNETTSDGLTFKRDSAAPDLDNDEVYVSYATESDITDSASKDFFGDLISNFKSLVNHIFAKTKVNVTLYVPDCTTTDTAEIDKKAVSGISDIEVQYKGKIYSVEKKNLQIENTVYAITEDASGISKTEPGEEDKKYSVATFDLDVSEETAAELENGENLNLIIKKAKDKAGNEWTGENQAGIASQNMLIIDGTAPKLTKVEYKSDDEIETETPKDTTDVYYANNNVTVSMAIDEYNFFAALRADEDAPRASEPLYTLIHGTEKYQDAGRWEKKDGNLAEAQFEIPAEDGTEKEYFFTLDYKDPSGNLMESTVDNNKAVYQVESGKYTSGTIVVDQIAPVLKQFKVVGGETDSLIQNGNYYYATNLEGDDVKVVATIDDNPDYFDAKAVQVMYNTINANGYVEPTKWQELDPERKAAWTVADDDERSHTAEYGFDGVGDNTYVFKITYADRAGNPLTLPESNAPSVIEPEKNNGTYTSTQKVVIKHSEPKLLDFSIVPADGEKWVSQKNDTFYAKNVSGNDVKVIATIDDNPDYFDKEAVRVMYNTVNANGDVEPTKWQELDPGRSAEWTVADNDKRSHTAVYEFDGVDDNTYVFKIAYVDQTNNLLANEAENTEAVAEEAGTFKSKQQVVIKHSIPKLLDFSIVPADGEEWVSEENGIFYAKNVAENDVKVIATIDDNPNYFDKEAVQVMYNTVDSKGDYTGNWNLMGTPTWSMEAGKHKAEYEFDGAGDDTYVFKITYVDCVDNALINEAENVEAVAKEAGTFKSKQQVVIKHTAPVLSNFYVTEPNGAELTKVGELSYALNNQNADDVEIHVSLNEDARYFDEESVVLKYQVVGTNDWTPIKVPENVKWEVDETTHTMVYLFDGDQDGEYTYNFQISYTDKSDNKLTLPKDTEDYVKEKGTGLGTYTVNQNVVIDHYAPELVDFHVKATDGTWGYHVKETSDFYATNLKEDDDVTITVSLDDNLTYFDADKVVLQYQEDGAAWENLTKGGAWQGGKTEESRVERTRTYTFDGDPEGEHTYNFRVMYTDRSGNVLVKSLNFAEIADADATEMTSNSGIYKSTQNIIIDHCAPKLSKLTFTDPVNMYDGELEDVKKNGTVVNVISDAETRLYYAEKATADFEITDKYFLPTDVSVIVSGRDYKDQNFTGKQQYSKDTIADLVVSGSEINEFSAGQEFKLNVQPNGDSEYYFTVAYTDKAGNVMQYAEDSVEDSELNEAYTDGVDKGVYTSPIMILDTQDPQLSVSYEALGDTNAKTEPDAHNSVDEIIATFTMTETNLDLDKTVVNVTAVDVNGENIECDEVTAYNDKTFADLIASGAATVVSRDSMNGPLNLQTLMMYLKEEANYQITITYQDKVNKEGYYESKTFSIDRTDPTIEVKYDGDKLAADSDITYETINTGAFARFLNKVTFGYFSKAQIKVSVTAHDSISGVKTISYCGIYEDEEGNTNSVYEGEIPVTLSGPKKDQATVTVKLPFSFKGTFTAHGTDWAENIADDSQPCGIISETDGKHEKSSFASVMVQEDKTPHSKTKTFYNTDVSILFSSKDEYSGLYQIDYLAGNDLKESKRIYEETGSEIQTGEKREYTIVASTNNQNQVKTALGFEDNAGHTLEVPKDKLPIINIDTTKPKIEVEYDNNDVENDKYYKDERTATVTISERNFDPDDVTFDLTGPNVAISGWSHHAGGGCTGGSDPKDLNHTDSCTWSCTIRFSEDGDYTFTCSCVDLAGNKAAYDQIDEFTIDQTFPEFQISYDNNNAANEIYYNAPRVATLTIEEHNFDEGDVEVTMTAKDDGSPIALPGVVGWSGSGDTHTAHIAYDYDGEFTFDIAYVDLAGNEMEDYEEDHFFVDLTLPEIEILDVENMSANNGTVAPTINVSDTNYDADGVNVSFSGYNKGAVNFASSRAGIGNGQSISYADIPHIQENDDLYTLTATAVDMAGNEYEDSIMFSVNRFGSVYVLSRETKELVDDYYTNQEINLEVEEINVDTLEFKEITYSKDGDIVTLKENEDFTVKASGSEATWKSYTYTIDADNFTEEGAYTVTISSEDRATNKMNNKMTEKDIEFVIDKTVPSVVVTGVENNAQYNANSRTVTVDAQDNILMDKVYVYLNGKESVQQFDAQQLSDSNGIVEIPIGSANDWQTVRVVSQDAAGNQTETEEIRFLITTNIFYQWYRNTIAFYGSIAAVVAGGLGIWFLILAKRKKNEEE